MNRNRTNLNLICCALLVFGIGAAYGDQFISIKGHYEENQRGNILSFVVLVILGSNSCEICATNSNDRLDWETVIYDATNTYLLTPISDHVVPLKAKGASLCGVVSPGRDYYMFDHSSVRTYIPWIVFCLQPKEITPENMHSPATPWRSSLITYGWRWRNISVSPDGRFLRTFSSVRDNSLDLDDMHEFRRPGFEYPTSADDMGMQKIELSARRRIPSGFCARDYECAQWHETNGMTIPSKATMNSYVYTPKGPRPVAQETMTIESVSLFDGPRSISASILPSPTYVKDYRYTRRNESRIFPYAEYIAMGQWKPENDPELQVAAAKWLDHGPRIGDFGYASMLKNSERPGVLAGTWVALLLGSLAALYVLARHFLTQEITTKQMKR